MGDLVDWFFKLMGRHSDTYKYLRYDVQYNPWFQLKMTLNDMYAPGWPIGCVSWERFERECHTDQVDRNLPTLEDLGVNLTTMEEQVPWELKPYIEDLYRRKAENLPLPEPEPPLAITKY